MSRYIIRKPKYLQGAGEARYSPNTVIVILISLVFNIACTIAGVIVGIVYSLSNVDVLRLKGVYSSDFLQPVLIITLFTLGLMILFTIIHVRSIEKRPLRTIGLVKERLVLKYTIGFGAGLLLLALNIGPALLALPITFTGFKPAAFLYFTAFIFQSAGEEFVFRGYMLSALMRRGGAVWAVVVSSVVFGLYHFPNPVLSMLSAALIGAVLSLLVLRTGSLWGAMGLHAAWNFCLGLVTTDVGLFQTDYGFMNIVVPKTGMEWLDVMQFAILLAAAAVLLFAGRNKLVVRKTEEQALLDKAFKLARNAVRDKAQFSYIRRIFELAQGAEGKTAALLYHAAHHGVSAESVKRDFGERIYEAADSLVVRCGEAPEDYWKRVSQYPAAVAVKNAERRLEEIMRPKSAAYDSDIRFSGLIQCPMLRWGITADHCRNITQAVDGGTGPDAEPGGQNDYIAMLDHSICKTCPVRRADRYYFREGQNCRG